MPQFFLIAKTNGIKAPDALAAAAAIFAGIYLSVLPMAGTIALRNLALLALLLILLFRLRTIWPDLRPGWVIVAWALYLMAFPLISHEHKLSLDSVTGQWGRNLLAMLAGAGLASLCHRMADRSTFMLGLLSTVPILLHLALVVERWGEAGSIPWGYWGREAHHADLGYAAGHAAIFLTAAIVYRQGRWRWAAVLLLTAAYASTVVAQSRAGFVFAVLGSALVFLGAFLTRGVRGPRWIVAGSAVVLVVVVGLCIQAFKTDPRWQGMVSKISAGFQGDALQIECEGTASIESEIIAKYGAGPQADSVINSLRDGDGARVIVLRAGLELAMAHPWGSDGSRQAFRKLLVQACENPKFLTAHAHNAWIDTVLAIGWAGMFLYLAVLLCFIGLGWRHLRRSGPAAEWAMVLVVVAIFWILRGMTDSVFRDHMLEMQGFVLAYAAVTLRRAVSRGSAQL